jgi:hypothetical protein
MPAIRREAATLVRPWKLVTSPPNPLSRKTCSEGPSELAREMLPTPYEVARICCRRAQTA